jgi:hypothetical protein
VSARTSPENTTRHGPRTRAARPLPDPGHHERNHAAHAGSQEERSRTAQSPSPPSTDDLRRRLEPPSLRGASRVRPASLGRRMLRRWRQCRACWQDIAAEYRYCPWCAASQRRKLVEFFRGADDDSRRALRVSRYLPEERVRFSVWDETGQARAALSFEDEAGSSHHHDGARQACSTISGHSSGAREDATFVAAPPRSEPWKRRGCTVLE